MQEARPEHFPTTTSPSSPCSPSDLPLPFSSEPTLLPPRRSRLVYIPTLLISRLPCSPSQHPCSSSLSFPCHDDPFPFLPSSPRHPHHFSHLLFSTLAQPSHSILSTATAHRYRSSNSTPYRSQPPLQLQSLAGKYATAAFTGALSKSSQALSQVEADLTTIQKLIQAKDKSTIFLGQSCFSFRLPPEWSARVMVASREER